MSTICRHQPTLCRTERPSPSSPSLLTSPWPGHLRAPLQTCSCTYCWVPFLPSFVVGVAVCAGGCTLTRPLSLTQHPRQPPRSPAAVTVVVSCGGEPWCPVLSQYYPLTAGWRAPVSADGPVLARSGRLPPLTGYVRMCELWGANQHQGGMM